MRSGGTYAVAPITLFQPTPPVSGGAMRKRLADCRDKWANVVNFGGFSNVPTSSQYGAVGTK